MRLSVNPNDPGYNTEAGFYEVFYRGILLGHVITADEEERLVICWMLDDQGKRIKNSEGKFYTETKRGEVHIRRKASSQILRRNHALFH